MASLHPLQDLIKARIAAMTYFASPTAVTIVVSDQGDIASRILEATAQLGGMAILIHPPTGGPADVGKCGGVDSLEIEIVAAENWIINRASGGLNKPAYSAIRELRKTYNPDGSGGLDGWDAGGVFGKLHALEYDWKTEKSEDGQEIQMCAAKFKCSETIG